MSGSQVSAEQAFADLLQAVADYPASLSIPLVPPVTFDGREYAEITLREPTAEEVRQAEEQLRVGAMLPHAQRNYKIHLVQRASGAPLAVVSKMGVGRLEAAMAYLNLFLRVGQGTGGY